LLPSWGKKLGSHPGYLALGLPGGVKKTQDCYLGSDEIETNETKINE